MEVISVSNDLKATDNKVAPIQIKVHVSKNISNVDPQRIIQECHQRTKSLLEDYN